MTIWSVPGVEQQPEIILGPWLVLECPDGTRFVIGYNQTDCEGRVSTALVEQDFANKTLRTASGRLYRLKGPPGLDADADWIWAHRAQALGVTRVRDVSRDFWPTHRPEDVQLVNSRIEELKKALKQKR